jgi:hypothetical protein
MRMIGICALLTATCAASPAAAHWQWTRWGMTPDQVIAASKGTARVGNREKSAQGDGTADVVGSYDAGGRIFTAKFYFQRGLLAYVVLGSRDWQACVQTVRDLQAVYGKPIEWSDGGVASNATWLDQTRGNRVKIVAVPEAYCELQYSPISSAAASGL